MRIWYRGLPDTLTYRGQTPITFNEDMFGGADGVSGNWIWADGKTVN